MATRKTTKKRLSSLELNDLELIHIRDVLSVRLPGIPATVSSALAMLEDRDELEVALWSKVTALCADRGIDLDDDAPDFGISYVSQPRLMVKRLDLKGNPKDPRSQLLEIFRLATKDVIESDAFDDDEKRKEEEHEIT